MIQIDMKMPKDCYHCPCHKHWDVNNYICGITGDTANYIGFRRDFCPLKEVSNVSTVEAIPKDQYEARLKADMVAMLVRLNNEVDDLRAYDDIETIDKCEEIIQEKINNLQVSNSKVKEK